MRYKHTLDIENPELAKQWHPTKNGELKPSDITPGSDKKVWWICTKNPKHIWEASVSHRHKGRGCPICAGKKVLKGENDLETLNPTLASEWHPTKNGDLKPCDVTTNSNIKVWWKCSKYNNHEWEAVISRRNSGTGCPICSGQQILEGFNDLQTLNPILAKEWHPTKNGDLKPSDVMPNSNKKVWWKCSKDPRHEWDATINSRNSGHDCPICSGRMPLKGETDLQTLNPALAKEWHPTKNGDLKPSDVTLKSSKKVWWKCSKNPKHEWEATSNARNSGTGCPICANKKVLKGENDLQTINSTLASEWHPTKNGDLKPSDVTPNSNKKVWWKCSKNPKHEWEATSNARNSGTGCPICLNQQILKGENDLESLNPTLAKEWHPTKNGDLKPSDVAPNSNKKVWWKCSKNPKHEWEAIINNRNKGIGCPICFNQQVLKGENDLETLNPTLAKEWHPTKNGDLKPYEFVAGSTKKVWWICSKDSRHEWEANIVDRNNGNGCPICSSKKIIEGINDLETLNPILASEWHPTKNGGLKPSMVALNANKKVWWKCLVNPAHEWSATVNSRNSGVGCPECSAMFSTSFCEQSILYYLKKVFPKATNRHTFAINGVDLEVDILIPEINTSVEYDGIHWHKDKEDKDKEKNNLLRGITNLIRIREFGLNAIEGSDNILLEECKYPKNIVEAIEKLIQNLLRISTLTKEHYDKLSMLVIDLNRDRINILNAYMTYIQENSLSAEYPEIAKEWHPTKNGDLKPEYFKPKSSQKVWWKCSKNPKHEWETAIRNRSNGNNCPICANQKVLKGENDLQTINPTLASEWHPAKNGNLQPSDVTPNSNKKVWWKCNKNPKHEWEAAPNARNKGASCPICSNQKVLKGENDLQTINPTLASEWHPTKNGNLKPYEFVAGATKKVWWMCSKDSRHEWEARIVHRNRGTGCPVCSGKKVIEGVNDFKTFYPEVANEWHPTKNGDLKPTNFTCGSDKKVWWKCSKNPSHQWSARISNRCKNKKAGCPHCYEESKK